LALAHQRLRARQVDLVTDVEGEEPDELPEEAHVGRRAYFFVFFSGTRMVSTGTWLWRTTFSATLPIRRWLSPLRPALPLTIESQRREASRMHMEASPT